MKSKDKDARAKLAACDKAVKEAAFAMAIESDETAPLSQTLDPMQWSIPPSYDGPHPHPSGVLDDATKEEDLFAPGMLPLEFVMAAVEGFKNQKLIHKRYVARLLISCKKYFEVSVRGEFFGRRLDSRRKRRGHGVARSSKGSSF